MDYPTDLPLKEIQEIITIVKNKSFETDKAKFCYDVWILSGYILSKTFPTNLVGTIDLTDEQIIDNLEKLCKPSTVTSTLDILLPLIIKWLMDKALSL